MLDGRVRIAPACYHVLHLIPLMVAHDRNYFVQEGLAGEEAAYAYDVVRNGLVPFGWEKFCLGQGMKEKAVDIALDVLAVTVFQHQRRPRGTRFSIIAGWRNQSNSVWVAGPDVRSLRDLRGKRIGIIDYGDIHYRSLRPWLSEQGLDPETDVTWVPGVYLPHNVAALRSGQVDCTYMRSWDGEDLVKEGYSLLLDVRRMYPRGRPDRVIVASDDFLDRRPDAAVAFLRAMIRAYWYIRDQPTNFERIFDIETRLRRESPDPDERRKFTGATPRHLEVHPFPIDGMASALDVVAQEEFDAGEIEALPDVAAACRFEFVQQAFGDLMARAELQPEYRRVKAVVDRLGY